MNIFKKMFNNKAYTQEAQPHARRQQPGSGHIRAYKLVEWWNTSFSAEEQKYIIEKYGGELITGNHIPNFANTSYFLTHLSSWFKTKQDIEIARKMISEAEKRYTPIPAIDEHFYYMHLINFYYRDRDNENSFNAAIKACEKQISISKAAKEYFLKESPHTLPSHTGFKQLAIIEEKRKNFEKALELSKRAKQEGWGGDWDDRIKRLEEKIAKQKG